MFKIKKNIKNSVLASCLIVNSWAADKEITIHDLPREMLTELAKAADAQTAKELSLVDNELNQIVIEARKEDRFISLTPDSISLVTEHALSTVSELEFSKELAVSDIQSFFDRFNDEQLKSINSMIFRNFASADFKTLDAEGRFKQLESLQFHVNNDNQDDFLAAVAKSKSLSNLTFLYTSFHNTTPSEAAIDNLIASRMLRDDLELMIQYPYDSNNGMPHDEYFEFKKGLSEKLKSRFKRAWRIN